MITPERARDVQLRFSTLHYAGFPSLDLPITCAPSPCGPAFPAASAHVRVDTGVRAGDRITPFYDPMIAKIIAHGADREQAIAHMADALDATRIEGLETNLAFLRNLVRNPVFGAGEARTNFIENNRAQLLASA